MLTKDKTVHEVEAKQAFAANIRCDKCRAQAYVKAEKSGFSLFFCVHHSKANIEQLVAQGFTLDDRSWAVK